jgi:hypothetical protein
LGFDEDDEEDEDEEDEEDDDDEDDDATGSASTVLRAVGLDGGRSGERVQIDRGF